MRFEDTVKLRGAVTIFIEENGQKTKVFESPNLITDIGRQLMAAYVGGLALGPVDRIKLGTMGHVNGNTLLPMVPVSNQASLIDSNPYTQLKLAGSPLITYALPEVSTRFIFVVEKENGNGTGSKTYTEAGLFNSVGEMFAVENFPAIIKTDNKRFLFEWTVYFTDQNRP